MWEQYKKTFVRIQVVIAAVTMAVLIWSHLWSLAALFFFTMQLGALSGAGWGVRLKDKIQRGNQLAARRS